MSALAQAVRGGQALAAPVVYRLAAALEQVPLQEMRDDPATAAFVLRSSQNLFGLRVVVNQFTAGFELEDAQLDAAVDVVSRLASELRGTAEVVGVLTGPATLAALDGAPDRPGEVYAKATRRYAEAGAAAVLFAERQDAGDGDTSSLAESANICRYYSIPSILLAPDGAPGAPVDAVLGNGAVLSAALLADAPPSAAPSWTGLLLTDDDLPADADPEVVMAWMSLLVGVRA